ncbi:Adaptive-response sensory-kinase SasA [Methylobacterium hispanicum]|uniref:histidine kinase n=1 Tax=Methylobacterium hispanicum TaxID=270350 RepID=A0AAV4ZX29_9HYPH|nr:MULTISPECIES: sensor histidine kinase [Methylobacterium]GJD92597.1 Adaptive-response sensory-kinase SasA [Methylobacterium hispanicum]
MSLRSTRSLRVRVAAYLMVPMAALAVTLGVGGAWFVSTFVTSAYDRVLAGSILSIAEHLTVQDGSVALDLPAAAFGMLSNAQRDSIYYSITDGGTFVTGYEDLPQPDPMPPPETLTYRDAVFRGQRVRIGAMLKPIYITRHAALVQVAETTHGRDLLVRRMLVALTALGATLAAVGSLLVWFAVRMGLSPMDDLRRAVENRFHERGAVPAFSVAGVPREALPLVEALNALLTRLNDAMTVLRRFTADASHQLRTPVAILKTHLRLLDRQPADSPGWRSSRADIDGAVDRLDRLIAQLLVLAGVEEAARRGDAIASDLTEHVRDTARDLVDAARQRRITLSFEGPEAPVVARVEPLLVEEILRNLIDNAIRYNRPGGRVRVSVTREATREGFERACIDVEDDGPGIPEDRHARVFERFYRLERQDDPTGSGLGLAIVKAFAERLGGTVSLHPGIDGRGLRVRVALTSAVAG